ncbi:DctP family TRAP transporter solute-binding subunit [Leucothrix sargassi]|nr:DctP family TRAP transporter solute-binding subunit [Leucothrix sargassi]
MRKLVLSVMVSGALMAGATSAYAAEACQDGEVKVKFSHVTNTDKHPKGIAASLLEKRVNEEMNGKLCMEVFPNTTLYNDNQVLEAMLQGDVQLAAPSLSKFEKFTKKYRIFDLPFMFTNMEAVNKFQTSETGQNMKDSMQRRGLQGLAFWHNGLKQMSANKPLLLPTDAKGLKFRVQASDVLKAQMSAIGASPQPMAFSEVYGALQTGVVDGQANTWSNIYGKKFFEVQDGITETNHGLLDYMLVTSTKFLKSLEPDVRDQFLKIVAEVTETRNNEAYALNQKNKADMIAAGGVVRQLTPEQREAWVTAMKPVWKQFEKDVGAENIAAAQKINAEVLAK